ARPAYEGRRAPADVRGHRPRRRRDSGAGPGRTGAGGPPALPRGRVRRVVVTSGFVEVATGIHVLRHPVLDVKVTRIGGDASALLVDTLTTAGQARELADMVAAMTAVP